MAGKRRGGTSSLRRFSPLFTRATERRLLLHPLSLCHASARESFLKSAGRQVLRLHRLLQNGGHPEELMRDSRERALLYGDTCLAQVRRQILPLGAERIDLGVDDGRGRKPAEVSEISGVRSVFRFG